MPWLNGQGIFYFIQTTSTLSKALIASFDYMT